MPENMIHEMQEPLQANLSAGDAEDFVKEFAREIEKALSDREVWSQNVNTYYLYEQGMVGKPRPDQPFLNSSNIRPLTSLAYESQIVPQLISALNNAPHLVRFVGAVPSDSRQEMFNDYQYRSEMLDFWDVVNAAAWRLVGPAGFTVVKATYDYTTEQRTQVQPVDEQLRMILKEIQAKAKQAGPQAVAEADQMMLQQVATHFKWDLEDDIEKKRAEDVLAQLKDEKNDVVTAIIERVCGSPIKLQVIDNHNDIIVPWYAPSIQESPWVAQWMVYDHRQLKAEEKCGKFKNVDEVIEQTRRFNPKGYENADSAQRPSESDQFITFRNAVQGLLGDTSIEHHVPVFEIHCWRTRSWISNQNGEPSDDDTYVRCVVDYCPTVDAAISILRAMEHPNDFEGLFNWPFVQIKYRDNRSGFYCGMGVPCLNNAFEQEEIVRLNAAIDRVTLATNYDEYFSYNAFLGAAPIKKPRMPGQRFQVYGDPRLAVSIPQRPDFSTAQHAEEEHMRQRGRELIGISDATDMPRYADKPPTKAQVDLTVMPRNVIQSHEVMNWLNGWSQIFRMVHLLNKQYRFVEGGSRVMQYTNEQNSSTPAYITKEDFDARFIVRAGGDAQRMDQQMEAQRSLAWVQLIGFNPLAAPMVNAAEFIPDITTELIGPIKAQKWTNPKEQAAQYQQQFMQMQAEALAKLQLKQQKSTKGAGMKPAKQMGGLNMGNLQTGAAPGSQRAA